MTTTHTPSTRATTDTLGPDPAQRRGPSIRVEQITSRSGDVVTLHPTTFSVYPGEVVGIAGGSGAGKTTLLETMAGVRAPTTGRVSIGDDEIAFVPQDDIIHLDLPLRRTLQHSAALRIIDRDERERAEVVDRVLRRLDLHDRADVKVADLSGGQRKRASLAAEMMTDPDLFFLDEPTSGLDPANAAELMTSLRDLAATGSTVVVSTHSPTDLARCDRVVFIGRGGHVAYVGSPDEAKHFFDVVELADIYEQLNRRSFATASDADPIDASAVAAPSTRDVDPRPGFVRQWISLSRRNLDLIKSNTLTLAILAGSPIFVISMMTLLFPSGSFAADAPSSAMAIQTLFWLAFNSFFFGITYGLLQVVGEFEIVRRERRVGLRLTAYVASKLTVLVPMLAVVNIGMLVAMEAADRLPATSIVDKLALFTSLQLLSCAAVGIGLHASSAVQNAAQATLALPMLCFPQILFAGAVVPVSGMGPIAEFMSMPLGSRWGFESLGRTLDLGPAAATEPGTAGFADAFTGSPVVGWTVLIALFVVSTVATVRTLSRRTAVTGVGR